MVEASDIQKRILRRAKSAEEYNLYRAGLEWDLTEPIVIESADDFKSTPRWQERLKPFQHQVTNLITFCRRLPVTLLADDVGLGKTISAGLVMSELVSRSRISKVLVVCPKILGPQWQSELISKFDLPAKFVTGRELLEADFEEQGVVITTYNSARLYLDRIPEDRFQMLVLDETSASNLRSTLYNESSGAFQRLVDQTIATGLHAVDDIDHDIERQQTQLLTRWAGAFGAAVNSVETEGANRRFQGTALVRVRATVLHDSYERLVEVPCTPDTHLYRDDRPALRALAPNITDIGEIGINLNKIAKAVDLDEGIAEFSRFYLERREQEIRYASGDERKARKLHDEFTPRFEATVVALKGEVFRDVTSRIKFSLDHGTAYEAVITAKPSAGEIIEAPQQDLCTKSGRHFPRSCLAQCEITGANVLRHLLARSELSARLALPEYIEVCSLSGKKVLTDELEISDITGRKVAAGLLLTCGATGKKAEKSLFGTCAFSNSGVLRTELSKSEVSSRYYRRDQEAVSAYSGKKGHQQEFVSCFETRQLVANSEAERCQETNEYVRPGILLTCEETGIRARPVLLDRCSVSGKAALKRLLAPSSISQKLCLRTHATQSASGKYCVPAETVQCAWSGEQCHPDDADSCELTGLTVHKRFLSTTAPSLVALVELLNNHDETAAKTPYPILENAIAKKLRGAKCRIISGAVSPTRAALAVCAETKSMLGLKSRFLGFVFRPDKKEIVGNVAEGRRTKQGWIKTRQ